MNEKTSPSGLYKQPVGEKKTFTVRLSTGPLNCEMEAGWLLIRKKEKPIADMFYTYYRKVVGGGEKTSGLRPLTFVFNGGPGASSVFLHIGALGPKAAPFGKRGDRLPPPVQLQDNADSWIDQTDLVFVDPVGTGFSRALRELDFTSPGQPVEPKKSDKPSSASGDNKEFYKLDKDLQSLAEFIQHFLSKYKRWSSPLFIAGESYGGFRAAKLSLKLHKEYGIGLSGVFILSPCLELNSFCSNDYDVLAWLDTFPSMAMTAAYHGKSAHFAGQKMPSSDSDIEAFLKPVEDFVTGELVNFLVQGESMDPEKVQALLKKAQAFMGLPLERVQLSGGRVGLYQFLRLLLGKERKWCGIYDASQTIWDPFPDRIRFEGPDPTSDGYEPVFTQGIQCLFREFLDLKCERKYRILNEQVNKIWKSDTQSHFFDMNIGSVDDLRSALALNPYMRVFICHGVFDMVTPYFGSKRAISLMRLPEELKKQVEFHVFYGGHMFYTWPSSRREFKRRAAPLFSRTP